MAQTAADLTGELRTGFSGTVVGPNDSAYEETRRVHNGMIDKRPALIGCCRTTADVAAAVDIAQREGLEVSVRGGGHNVSGKAVTDGGLMIDLSPMKEVSVDPSSGTARSQAGVLWREYNDATHAHGLATTGGVISTTGVAGLTLGGGIGWLMGSRGLSIDNLLSAEVVLASGEVVVASDATDPDLFWAIRGGGGNFGVVTSFTFAAHPLDTVLGGLVGHAIESAPDVFRFYRDFATSIPDDLTCALGLTHAPDGSEMQICGVPLCHSGADPDRAVSDVKALREFGPPLVDMVDRMPYPVVNTLLDDGFLRGSLNYWKSAFLTDLSDDAIDTMVESFRKCPTPMCGVITEHFHGAATRVAPTATAFPHRTRGYNAIIIGQWLDPAQTDECRAWVRGTYDALRPHMADEAYVNYLGADEADRIRAAYGPNYERLVELKRRYDPENLFRLNQNIDPKGR